MEQSEKKVLTQESTISTDKPKPSQINRTFKSFFLSKKLWMTVFGLAVLWLAYWGQVAYLYSFAGYPQEMAAILIPSFVSLTKDFMVAFTAVVLAFLGVDGVISWRHGTESVVNQATSFVKEKKEEIITQNINEKIIYEGGPGASEVKPYSKMATDE